MAIPTLDKWIKETSSAFSSRSAALIVLDIQIENYQKERSEGNLKLLKRAFILWQEGQTKKGQDWRLSARNQTKAMTYLDQSLQADFLLSPEEVKALEWVAQQREDELRTQFAGRFLSFKSSTLMGIKERTRFAKSKLADFPRVMGTMSGGVLPTAKLVHGSMALAKGISDPHATPTHTMRNEVIAMLRDLGGGGTADAVFEAIGLGTVASFAAEATPLLGIVWSGVNAARNCANMAIQAAGIQDMESRRRAIGGGNPMSAFGAVLRLLEKELAATSIKASVSATAFGLKLASTFADAGLVTTPAIGLLQTLFGIFQTIIEYRRDCEELAAANALIIRGSLNTLSNQFDNVFTVCPLLGCYYLLIQDASTIIALSAVSYHSRDLEGEALALLTKVKPVLVKCRELIAKSRFEISAFETSKGIVDATWAFKHSAIHTYGKKEGLAVDRRVNAMMDGFSGVALDFCKQIMEEVNKYLAAKAPPLIGPAPLQPDFSSREGFLTS